MSRTYKVTGINLKGMPLGESDRLLTILTQEQGLIRVAAPGARKHQSRLGGRSGLFVVNELLISKGRSLDRITQAETLASYPGLSLDLGKLTASQYLAELALCQALDDHPQPELFSLLTEHLGRMWPSPATEVLPRLTHGLYHLMALAGVAPNVQVCCLSQQPVLPDLSGADWQAGFSIQAGGVVHPEALDQLLQEGGVVRRSPAISRAAAPQSAPAKPRPKLAPRAIAAVSTLNAAELSLLQQLPQPYLFPTDAPAAQRMEELPEGVTFLAPETWRTLEQLLRQYAQYHFDRTIRSASLIDACL